MLYKITINTLYVLTGYMDMDTSITFENQLKTPQPYYNYIYTLVLTEMILDSLVQNNLHWNSGLQ